jgi:hypothetical protein
MNLPAGLLVRMKDEVSIRNYVTDDAYGNPVFESVPAITNGRLENRYRRMTSINGEEIVSTKQLYIPDVAGMSPQSQVTLPDGTTPKIRSFARLSWPNGAYHIEIGF